MRRQFAEWRRRKIYEMYGFYKSEEVQERIARFKGIFWSRKESLEQGIVRYKKIAFWWQKDESEYFGNSRFKRWWRFRQAKK